MAAKDASMAAKDELLTSDSEGWTEARTDSSDRGRGCAEVFARCVCMPFTTIVNIVLALFDGCCYCASRQPPEWSRLFGVVTAVLRSMAYNLAWNVRFMRLLTDHNIPTWLPTLPRGLRLAYRRSGGPESCPVPGEWTFSRSSTTGLPWVTPPRRVVLYFHGGAFALCTPGTHRGVIMRLVTAARAGHGAGHGADGADEWVAFAVDYRRPPEHPHPAPVEDCVAAYRWLLGHMGGGPAAAARIVFAGDSAGGALVVAAMDALRRATPEPLPQPAGGILLSPWVDLEDTSSESWRTNVATDFLPPGLARQLARCYVMGAEQGQQQQETVVADRLRDFSATNLDLAGLPPLHIMCGAAECLRDQVLVFAEKARTAGVDVQISVEPGMVHVFVVLANVARAGSAERWFGGMAEFLRKVVPGGVEAGPGRGAVAAARGAAV